MRVLSLFSGVGGIDLGLERAGMQIVGQCENDEFCIKVLKKHWPEVARFGDIRNLSVDDIRRTCGHIDIVVGGSPCQDISVAGKGQGLSGARSSLYWEMWRLVNELRPDWLLFENVNALRTRGGDEVLASLEELGYTCWPVVVGAWAVGAPHQRNRVWIVANHVRLRERGSIRQSERRMRALYGCEPSRQDERRESSIESVADADGDALRIESGRVDGPDGEKTSIASTDVLADCDGWRCEDERIGSISGDENKERGNGVDRCDCEKSLGNPDGEFKRSVGLERGRSMVEAIKIGAQSKSASELANPERDGLQTGYTELSEPRDSQDAGLTGASENVRPPSIQTHRWPAPPGQEQFDHEPPRVIKAESGLGGDALGLSRRMDKHRLKALGNSVVPQVVQVIGEWIMEYNNGIS